MNFTYSNKVFLLALGNDILGDDGIAIEVADILKKEYQDKLEVESVFGGGLELLDILEGKERAIIIDSIVTGDFPLGTIRELSLSDLSNAISGSPHYMGLPDVLRLSAELDIPFPKEMKILAIETEAQYEVREGLSSELQKLLPNIVLNAKKLIQDWMN
ncbi:MAG: hydrogenase maturation protease [bacterium]